jgi:hypothetical protein
VRVIFLKMSKGKGKGAKSYKSESAAVAVENADNGVPVSAAVPAALAALQVNLSAIKRVDSRAVEIVHTTSFAVLYKLQLATKQWERANVEGTLFLYRAASSRCRSLKFEICPDD